MKKLLTLAAALILTACASPKNATLEDGKITNISSAEATTLMLGEQRRAKVEDVQTNQKPIFKVTAKAGEDIVFKGIASIEIYTPLDLDVLMSEQAPQVSENVQILREVRGIGRETITPLGLAGLVVQDRKNSAANALEASRIDAETERQRNEATANLTTQAIDAASKPPVILQVPMGSSVLPTE